MITKLIENELYIADKIILTPDERMLLDLFLTFEKIGIEPLSQIINKEEYEIKKIIKEINKKIGFYFTIVRCRKKESFDTFYKIKQRRN